MRSCTYWLSMKERSVAEFVKEAVAADAAQDYQVALEKYKAALDYFSAHLKYEKNPRARETITTKVCLERSVDRGSSSRCC